MKSKYCLECHSDIDDRVYYYSTDNYGVALCRKHQEWLDEIENHATEEAIELYFELKKKDIAAQLEKFDGFKTIDIAIPKAKINIEVDGRHHNYDPRQALSDLQRTFYSFKKGYFTIRIPNSLIYKRVEETANIISEMVKDAMKK